MYGLLQYGCHVLVRSDGEPHPAALSRMGEMVEHVCREDGTQVVSREFGPVSEHDGKRFQPVCIWARPKDF